MRRIVKLIRAHPGGVLALILLGQLAAACPMTDPNNVTGGGGGTGSAPSAPSNLAATPSSATQINLTWTDNSSNEDGFRIERAPGGTTTFAEIGTVAGGVTSYQSTGLTGSTAYSYRVRAYNASGNSAYSSTADATTMLAAPDAPSSLTASGASSSQVNITWTDNSNNEDGFRIEVTTTGVSGFSEIATVAAGITTYQHTGLTPSTGYTYRVRSYNAAGTSAYSNSAVGFTSAPPVTPPAAPTNLTATGVGPNTISLTWTDNSTDETGFKIERAPGGTTSFVEIVTANAGQTVYLNAGLTAATQYSYRVRAYNSAGNSAYTLTATATTTGGAPPAAPSGLGATPVSASKINLAWTDNANNEDGFKIERCQGASCSSFVQVATLGPDGTAWQDSLLSASTSYSYRVRAYNGAGNSSYSATATAITNSLGSPPAAPSGLGAAAAASFQINLTWTDNSTDETGFKIERCTGVSCSSFVEIDLVAANVTVYPSTGLTEGTTYGFRVRAYNAAGNSAYSNTASATTDTPLPTLPTNLVATAASASQINLTWNDNSTNETGFSIERCSGAACSNFAEIIQVGAGVVAYQNTGLSASTLYRYRVRAYNLGGNSLYSNEAEATTTAPTPPADPSGLGATVISSSQINLAWTDNSNNETGFSIERCSGVSCSGFAEIITVAAGVTTYQNTGLTASTSYSYRVRAYNAAGNSGFTSTATATTQAAPPAAPSSLAATASATLSSVIRLTWVDNSLDETEFRVEQQIGAGSFVDLGPVPANTILVDITGLAGNTQYSYRVRAHNGAGYSSYSNTATATTLPSQITFLPSAHTILKNSVVDGVTTSDATTHQTFTDIGDGCNGISNAYACVETAIQFAGLQSYIAGRTITSATLRLYPYTLNGDTNTQYAVNAFNASWDPATITWANRPLGLAMFQAQKYSPQNYSVYDFDVTGIVQYWANGTWTNYGLWLRDLTGAALNTTRTTGFYGLNYYNNLNQRPVLIVNFQ